MAITDELREWARNNTMQDKVLTTYPEQHPVHGTVESLLRIADRIDAEHEHEISRAAQLLADAEKDRDFNYANWQDCKQKVLQHNITIDELDAEIERLKDGLAHRIELPKDADGEYIHIGDDMETLIPPFKNEHCKVVYIALTADGWEVDGDTPDSMRHHKQSTVEDVLRDMHAKLDEVTALYVGEAIDSDERDSDEARIFAEYAQRLQLREVDE